MDVKVSSLARLRDDCREFRPSHVLSVLDPTIARDRIPKFTDVRVVLQLFFHDDDDSHLQQEPLDESLQKILTFLYAFIRAEDGDKRLLVHCHAGASRSPAIVYILFAMALGAGREEDAFAALLARTVKPWPSRSLIELADSALDRSGRMLQPLCAYRLSFPRRYEYYMRLNRRRAL